MKRRSPIKRYKRVNPKRRKPRRRLPDASGHGIRLYGKERSARRAEIFERAGGRCEEMVCWSAETIPVLAPGMYGSPTVHHFETRCSNKATEWSHRRHGCHKCDCMECGIASCRECHQKKHNAGGKPIAVRKRDIKMEVA